MRSAAPTRDCIDVDLGKQAEVMENYANKGTRAVMQYPVGVTDATWWKYVATVTGNAAQKDIASATGIDQSSISRWQRGANKPRAEAVVTLARTYGRSPVEALVAAGYLSSSEPGVVELTTLTGDLRGASIDSLLAEIRRRLVTARPDDAQPWPTGWAADNTVVGGDEYVEQRDDLTG